MNGPKAHPLYEYLKHEKKGLLGSEGIKWNFTKFLVGRNGEVVERVRANHQTRGHLRRDREIAVRR